MPKLENPNFPQGTYPYASPNPKLSNESVNGGQETPVIVVTPPKTAIDPTEESAEIAILEQQIAGKQDKLTFDTAPTQNSTNPVTSGGVYNALQNVGGEDIVTITATGVQSDEMAAKIEAAKAVYYDNRLYGKYSENGTTISFRMQTQPQDTDSNYFVNYTISTKTIEANVNSYNRISSISGRTGNFNLDDSLNASNNELKLTGKLPYLTSLPSTDNTSGFLTIVKCTSEPAQADRHEGYLYIVTSA